VIVVGDQRGRVDLPRLMQALGARGINEVHVEAGQGLNGALLQSGCVDELLLYLAPLLVGDAAQGLFRLPALSRLEDAIRLDIRELSRIGDDYRVIARPRVTGPG
jgi:diaminohydroxyphosphoribosylaminopyrimidine deaminase/5-amino-6-(5-phosphoribosylamino)uracil reductase